MGYVVGRHTEELWGAITLPGIYRAGSCGTLRGSGSLDDAYVGGGGDMIDVLVNLNISYLSKQRSDDDNMSIQHSNGKVRPLMVAGSGA